MAELVIFGKASGQHLFAGSGAKYGREGMKWMTNYFAELEVGCSSTSVGQFFDGIEFVSLPEPSCSQVATSQSLFNLRVFPGQRLETECAQVMYLLNIFIRV